jgi:tetratricopeptide (TPR) repeat protein
MSSGRTPQVAASLFCAVVMVTALARPARADDAATARRAFTEAEKLYAAAEFDRALVLYRKAYELKALPGFHFNIGQCYRKLGQCDKALEHYRLYLSQSKRPASASRLKAWQRNKGDVKVLIQLCEKELANRGAANDPEAAPVEEPPDLSEGTPPEQPAPAPSASRRRLSPNLFWTGVGLTGAMLLTSVIMGSAALAMSSEYKDPETSLQDRLDLKDTGEVLRTTSTVTFVLAVTAAAGSAALYFFTDFDTKEAAVAAAPLQGGGVLMMEGRF